MENGTGLKLSQKGVEALEKELQTAFGADAEKEIYRLIAEAYDDFTFYDKELADDGRGGSMESIRAALYYFLAFSKKIFEK